MNAADRARLNDMLDMARRILRLIEGKNRPDLDKNDMLLGLAVIRALEVIGEAAANIGDDFQQQHPAIPWKQMIGMRNYLIHRYARVDLNIVWDTASLSISSLIPQLEALLSEEAP